MKLEDPLALGLVLGGFAFGVVLGWLCGVTWMARAMLRRDAHVLDQAASAQLGMLIDRLRATRIAPVRTTGFSEGDGHGL
jgi:hypothetical protein